jgi:hypothetical protein
VQHRSEIRGQLLGVLMRIEDRKRESPTCRGIAGQMGLESSGDEGI